MASRMDNMIKRLLRLWVLLWAVQAGWAQSDFGKQLSDAAIPTITIHPEDVVQNSIEHFPFPSGANTFVVRWQYTEEGAKRVRAFWDAHTGRKIRTRIGSFESPLTLVLTSRLLKPSGTVPWEKVRTDKFVSVSGADANAIVAGLRDK
jgi:hypothetical protein